MRDPLTPRELLIVGIATGAVLALLITALYGAAYLSGSILCRI